MKRIMTIGAMAVALLTATGCSETETDVVIDSGDGDQVALGITPNLKVDAGTKATTKSVVSGEAITYDINKYGDVDYAPGLGALITNKDVSGWYTPDVSEYTGHHVWYIGSEKGAGWISIKEKKDTYKLTKEVPYYLTDVIGKVYAYYPYDATVTDGLASVNRESDLKIPTEIQITGEIVATINNAKKYWKTNAWVATDKGNQGPHSLAKEKDYLYFAGEAGRYVNNGRTPGETPFKPEDEPDNNNAINPGYKINLDMKHAMAMVSFRVYDGGKLSDKDVKFKKFRIKNTDASSGKPFKMGGGYMALADGTITDKSLSAGDISRTVTDYILMRLVDDNGTEGEHAFKANGTTVNAKIVSKSVSAIVYPTTFSENDMEVIVTLQVGTDPEVEYPVILPGSTWEANNNYIYTLSAGRNKLTVANVSVTTWSDEEQDELPL